MASRYYPQKDLDTIDKFNRELLGEPNIDKDGIINQTVIVYKVSVYDTESNMYGESSEGKVYKTGVQIPCLITPSDFDYNTDEFGPDRRQNVEFAFQRDYLVEIDFRPNIGDIVKYNDGYFEINTFNENQLVGGQTDNNHSIVATAHLTRLSTLNIEEHRGF